ncbi:MAG: hypothetical protein V8Q79_09275 [Christensenellales bacterium]
MRFLLMILQAVALGCASAAAGRRVMHYLQLESYQLPGYVKSVKRNARRAHSFRRSRWRRQAWRRSS